MRGCVRFMYVLAANAPNQQNVSELTVGLTIADAPATIGHDIDVPA